jgi:lipopolysaccharide export system protein LptA
MIRQPLRVLSAVPRAATLALVLAAPLAVALTSDRDAPIEISADRAEIDDATGTATYFGDVRMDQGTLRVTAATLTIETDDDDAVTRITAEGEPEGEPARYQQQPEPDAELVRAQARTIVYFTGDERIELSGKARLRQAQDRFEGDRITYDLRERRVAAQAGREDERVNFTIDPARTRSSADDDGD